MPNPRTSRRSSAPTVEMTGKQIINMLLSVTDIGQATVAILELEDYADRRAAKEGLNGSRVRRGIVSRVTKGASKRQTLALLNEAQDALVAKKKAIGAARFDGTYVKKPLRSTRSAKATGTKKSAARKMVGAH